MEDSLTWPPPLSFTAIPCVAAIADGLMSSVVKMVGAQVYTLSAGKFLIFFFCDRCAGCRSKRTAAYCFRGCNITSAFDSSEDGYLPNRLADICAVALEDCFEFRDECL